MPISYAVQSPEAYALSILQEAALSDAERLRNKQSRQLQIMNTAEAQYAQGDIDFGTAKDQAFNYFVDEFARNPTVNPLELMQGGALQHTGQLRSYDIAFNQGRENLMSYFTSLQPQTAVAAPLPPVPVVQQPAVLPIAAPQQQQQQTPVSVAPAPALAPIATSVNPNAQLSVPTAVARPSAVSDEEYWSSYRFSSGVY